MNIKLLTVVPVLALAELSAPLAHAIVSTTLSVGGQIAPVACNLTLAGGGNFDYGDFYASTLHATGNTALAPKHLPYTIQCQGYTRVALTLSDNRADTVGGVTPDEHTFGLGVDQAGGHIGYTIYKISYGFITDFNVSGLIESSNDGESWQVPVLDAEQQGFIIKNSRSTMYSFAEGSVMSPKPILNLTGEIGTYPVVAAKAGLDVARIITLDGSATMELFYL